MKMTGLPRQRQQIDTAASIATSALPEVDLFEFNSFTADSPRFRSLAREVQS
jgi:hypothetical protein